MIAFSRVFNETRERSLLLVTAKCDGGRELNRDIGIGTHGIYALDYVLDNRFYL